MIRTNLLFCFGIIGIAAQAIFASALSAEPVTADTVTGQVEFRMPKSQEWQPMATGMRLDLPSEIRAGQNSGARLSQQGSTFTLKSNTRVTLEPPAEEPEGLVKRVKQWLGTVLYRIERRPDEFSVETPFLVSTVKGTEFVVVSSDTGSFVTLMEGSLEVEDLASGELQMMQDGDVVEAGTSEGMRSLETSTSPDGGGDAGQPNVSGASAEGLASEEVGSGADDGGFGEELESLREMEAEQRAEDDVNEDMAPEDDLGMEGEEDGGPSGDDEGPGDEEVPDDEEDGGLGGDDGGPVGEEDGGGDDGDDDEED
ncbi:MAG: FecR domain-containing protein [Marinobacter sp.]|uniref:FecR domain-containing protein n=1 Tax=Marinobacter sp. TaxID=50741 RepID=UPI00349FD653